MVVLDDGTEKVYAYIQQLDPDAPFSASFKVFDDCDPVWTPTFGRLALP